MGAQRPEGKRTALAGQEVQDSGPAPLQVSHEGWHPMEESEQETEFLIRLQHKHVPGRCVGVRVPVCFQTLLNGSAEVSCNHVQSLVKI